jgi:phage terminase large subunit
MDNFMYGLSWRSDGYGDVLPKSATLAVSNDKEKLMEMMREYVTKDCKEVKREDYESDLEYEEDMWSDNTNFELTANYGEMIVLTHRKNTLNVIYEIVMIEVI